MFASMRVASKRLGCHLQSLAVGAGQAVWLPAVKRLTKRTPDRRPIFARRFTSSRKPAGPIAPVCPLLPVRWLALHCASEGCSGGPSRSSSQEDEPCQILGKHLSESMSQSLGTPSAIADAGREGEVRFFGEVDASDESMRRVIQRIANRFDRVHFCYEAGPTGYGLYRLIRSLGHECTVVAPSLIPRKPSDRVKTNRRDALGLARLLRAGELTAVWVPDEGPEAMRDLVRARAAAVETLRVHRQHVSAFMLKHGRIFPRKKGWTMRYLCWLQAQQFDHPAHQIALQEMVEAVRISKERAERLERVIEEFVPAWSLAPVVRALQTLRGVDLIVAVTFATEIGDVRRFESPRQLMGYVGLVPGER